MLPATQPPPQGVHSPHLRTPCAAGALAIGIVAPQHFLYFFPLPQGQGSFLAGFMVWIEGRRYTTDRLDACQGAPERKPMAIYLTSLLSILNQIGVKGSKMLVALYAIELGASPLAIGALISTYAIFPLLLAVYAGRGAGR